MSAKFPAPIRNRGHFRKGQSGNPAGRPRGTRNKATLRVEALLAGGEPRVTRGVAERALDSGDPALLRYCLVRLLPPARRRRVELDLSPGNDADALATIIRAMADGLVSPLEARDIARSIAARRPTVATGDLERRLAELERVERESAAYPPCPSPASRERVASAASRVRV